MRVKTALIQTMMETALGLKTIDFLATLWQSLRRVRVQAHRGSLFGVDQPCLFINVINLSSKREVEITHVWVDTNPQFPVLNLDRPLPKRLKPDETWETWVPLEFLPRKPLDVAVHLGRVQLSNGKVFRSVPRKQVPTAGFVPGG